MGKRPLACPERPRKGKIEKTLGVVIWVSGMVCLSAALAGAWSFGPLIGIILTSMFAFAGGLLLREVLGF